MNLRKSMDPNKLYPPQMKFVQTDDFLPNDGVQLSSSFSDNTTAPEIKYVLSNFLSDQDVADLEAKYSPSICEYCSKENLLHRNSESSCCDQQELDKYVKEVRSKQIEDRISTYFLLRPRRLNAVSQEELEEMKRFIMEENYRRGMSIELPIATPDNATISTDESQIEIKLKRGSRRTFRKLKKKMDRIKMFWPQLFDSQMDPINVWGNMTEDNRAKKIREPNEQDEMVVDLNEEPSDIINNINVL